MRDILSDLEAGKQLSDENPIVRAQKQMQAQLPKRFYEKAEVAESEGGFAVHLDGRPVKTPARNLLLLPPARRPRSWPMNLPHRKNSSIRAKCPQPASSTRRLTA